MRLLERLSLGGTSCTLRGVTHERCCRFLGRGASADRIALTHFLARDYILKLPVAERLAKVSILI
jgi:hypothetical protein